MILFSYEFRRQRELSVQNRNFHITSAFNKIFETLISGEIVQWSFQWFILYTPSVNNLVSTKKGHKKASRTFFAKIYSEIRLELKLRNWFFDRYRLPYNMAQSVLSRSPIGVALFWEKGAQLQTTWEKRITTTKLAISAKENIQVEKLLRPKPIIEELGYPQEPIYEPALPDETTAEKRQREQSNIKRKVKKRKGSCKNLSLILQDPCKNQTLILQDSCKNSTLILQESCKSSTPILQESYKIDAYLAGFLHIRRLSCKILQESCKILQDGA